MSCPLCGFNEECRCSTPEFQPRHVRRSRFIPDSPPRSFAADQLYGTGASSETEPSEVSEQQFAASLSAPSSPRRARFVLAEEGIGAAESQTPTGGEPIIASTNSNVSECQAKTRQCNVEEEQVAASEICEMQSDELEDTAPALSTGAVPEDSHWREEVAERVHSYRVRRRRRAPRYPSLSLKFESPEPYRAMASTAEPPVGRISLDAAIPEPAKPVGRSYAAASPVVRPANVEPKIIEFPKPVPPPLPILDVPIVEELAEPVVEGPRILDAPEAPPQAPPLGGITLEPPAETAPALELPLQVASVAARLTAAVLDGFFVILAAALFAGIAFKISSGMSARALVGVSLGVSAVLWAVYHYVLITYAGSTPGMEMAQIRLSCFDGEAPSKPCRRGRALAMMLSAISFALGYLWCLFDEDTLCWHDRITHTYASRGARGSLFAAMGALVCRFFPEQPRS